MFPPLTNHWFGAGLGRRPTAPNEHASDLTGSLGYGQSDKPAGSSPHDEYSKREMASDQVQLMLVSLSHLLITRLTRTGRQETLWHELVLCRGT